MTKPATLAAAGSSRNRTGKDLSQTIPAATQYPPEPRCALCPLCRCHADCRITDQPRRVKVAGDLWHGRVPDGAVYVGRAAPGLKRSRWANSGKLSR